jgi:hypothetical protein
MTTIINGSDAADTITLTTGNYTINAGGGANTITATSGDNIINSGDGVDTISVTSGNNTINAGAGANTITSTSGTNIINTGDGADTITSGGGGNTIFAGAGANTITTTSGDDTITTGDDADTITAGDGDNVIDAGNGANTITTGAGDDTITGGDDVDTIVTGGGDDLVYTGNGANTVTTGPGDDTVFSGVDVDTLTTGPGDDKIYITGGADTIAAGTGTDTLFVDYSAAPVAVVISTLAGTLSSGYAGTITGIGVATFAGVENFDITPGSFNDVITTGDGTDIIRSSPGDDLSILGGGDDEAVYAMAENAGATDVYQGGNGSDTLSLIFTFAEWSSPLVQTDIANYQAFQATQTDPITGEADSAVFQFTAFDLSASEFEDLIITVLPENVVIFDLVQGVSSSHSNRIFDASLSYTIYVRVNSDSGELLTVPNSGPGTWGRWSGQLGADDTWVLVGDTAVKGPGGVPVSEHFMGDVYDTNEGERIGWGTVETGDLAQAVPDEGVVSNHAASVEAIDGVLRLVRTAGDGVRNYAELFANGEQWLGDFIPTPPADFQAMEDFGDFGSADQGVYLIGMPGGLLASQGLADL